MSHKTQDLGGQLFQKTKNQVCINASLMGFVNLKDTVCQGEESIFLNWIHK